MNRTLLTQALIKFLAGIILVGLLVFLPAGSLSYWQGWLLMGVLFVPMFFAGIVMLAKNPDLLSKRLNAKELVDITGLGSLDSRCPLYSVVHIICGSIERKRISFQNHRSPGGTEGHRYWVIWHSPSPDVYGNSHHVPIYAIGPRFPDIIHDHARIYSRNCEEDQE